MRVGLDTPIISVFSLNSLTTHLPSDFGLIRTQGPHTRGRLGQSFLFCILALAIGIVIPLQLLAQQSPDIAPGLQPGQSYDSADIDNINLWSGDLTVRIPLISYTQRGGALKLSFSLLWNGKPWIPFTICAPSDASNTNDASDPNFRPPSQPPDPPRCGNSWQQNGRASSEATSALEVPTGMSIIDDQDVQTEFSIYTTSDSSNPGYETGSFSTAVWHTADGSVHVGAGINSPQAGQISLDGSNFYTGSPHSVYQEGTNVSCTQHCYSTDAQGISYHVDGSNSQTPIIRQDAHGNQILGQRSSSNGPVTAYTDTVGRTIPLPPTAASASTSGNFSGCNGALPTYSVAIWSVPGANGSTLDYKFCFAQVSISLPAITPSILAHTDTTTNLQSVVLPNGEGTWTFAYQSSSPADPAGLNYGDLSQITYPNGATLSYSYQFLKPICGSTRSMAVLTRSLDANDGTGPHTWTYSGTFSALIAVSDPLGNETDHTFIPPTGQSVCTPTYETKTQRYQGPANGGTLLQTVNTSYQYVTPDRSLNPIYSNLSYAFPTSTTTTLASGESSVRTKTLCCSISYATDSYDSSTPGTNGLTQNESISQYASSGTGALLRQVQTMYEFQQNSAYATANLLNLPASILTLDGSGNTASSTSYTYDEASYLTSSGFGQEQQLGTPVSSVRGDPTTITHFLDNGTIPPTHTNWYDTGEVYKQIDAKGQTSVTYAYSSAYNGAYPTTSTNALGQTQTYAYDKSLGMLTSVIDANYNTTSYGYDNTGRFAYVSYPDGGSTGYVYNDAARTITKTVVATPDPSQVIVTTFDGLGRKYASSLTSDPNGTDTTETRFDPLGRVSSVSNPYRSSPSTTDGTTYYSYDALGRQILLQEPDGSTQQWCYDGVAVSNSQTICTSSLSKNVGTQSWVDHADEVGNRWQHTSDAQGRLVAVMEPGGDTGVPPTLETDYSYDANGNLLLVTQNGTTSDTPRIRRFRYDSLSRLIWASNPETTTTPNGVVCYGQGDGTLAGCQAGGYDPNGNLLYRTDARGVITAYSYDALNRLVNKTYSGTSQAAQAIAASTPPASWQYDVGSQGSGSLGSPVSVGSAGSASVPPGNTVGKLTAEFTGPTGNRLTARNLGNYDSMGRLTSDQQCAGPCESPTQYNAPLQYTYDFAGNVTTAVNGSNGTGILLSYTYDGSGRLSNIASSWGDAQHPSTLFSAISGLAQYTPGGNLQTVGLGNPADQLNPLFRTDRTFDKRLRITGEKDVATGAALQASGSINFSEPDGTPSSNCLICAQMPDSGTITISIGGGAFTTTVDYDGESPQTLASEVATALNSADDNGNSPLVTAQGTGSSVLMSSLASGPVGNYTLNVTITDTDDYGNPTETTNLAGAMGATPGISLYSYSVGYDAASNVSSATDSVMGQWIYGYDGLRRLTNGTASTGPYAGQSGCWSYDNFGNRTGESISQTSCANLQAPMSSTQYNQHNQISATTIGGMSGGPPYDLAGDVQSDGLNLLAYDAEGRICAQLNTLSSSVTGYLYDADGHRVAKGTASLVNGILSCDMSHNGFVPTNIFVLDQGGQQLTETDGATNWRHSNVYASGSLLATYDASGLIYHFHDWLGSNRLQVNAGSSSQQEACQSLPFGNAQICNGTSDVTEQHFTGKERDTESGLDYFGARYYGSNMGRFMSPDWNSQPDEIPSADIRDPQSLNLYSYVKNNPLRHADPDGHCCVEEEEATETGTEIGAEIGTFFEPGGGTVVGGAIGGVIGLGLGIYADYKIAHYLSQPHINMMGKGGNQNHSETDLEHLSDKELSDMIKDPTTSTNDRQKAVTEQKARATRNAAKRGAKKPKAAPVKNDPASVRARQQQQAQPVVVPVPAPAPPPDPPKPPKDDHGDHPDNQ